jgi:hypothetical protein
MWCSDRCFLTDLSFSLPYPWWLNGALAIWALLALLCCCLLLPLLLFRVCCKAWRRRRAARGKGKGRRRLLDTGGIETHHFASAPLPPVPVYGGRGAKHERFYDDFRPYAGAANAGAELISEEEIITGFDSFVVQLDDDSSSFTLDRILRQVSSKKISRRTSNGIS